MWSKIVSFVKKYWVLLVLIVAVVLFFVFGLSGCTITKDGYVDNRHYYTHHNTDSNDYGNITDGNQTRKETTSK